MRFTVIALACVLCAACAGRDATPVATVQPHDQVSDCAMITAEIEANNAKVQELANERGLKVAQNVAAGVTGIIVWPAALCDGFQRRGRSGLGSAASAPAVFD